MPRKHSVTISSQQSVQSGTFTPDVNSGDSGNTDTVRSLGIVNLCAKKVSTVSTTLETDSTRVGGAKDVGTENIGASTKSPSISTKSPVDATAIPEMDAA